MYTLKKFRKNYTTESIKLTDELASAFFYYMFPFIDFLYINGCYVIKSWSFRSKSLDTIKWKSRHHFANTYSFDLMEWTRERMRTDAIETVLGGMDALR